MANSIAVLTPGQRVLDANGNPVSGAKLAFYDAGTTTPKTVFADAELTVGLGTTVFCDAGAYPVTMEGGTAKTLIYVGISSYKVEIYDSNDVLIAGHDNVQGAIDTSLFEAGAIALPSTPVLSRTANDSVDVAERATLFNCNPTGGSFVVTLPSAVTAGDGWRVGIRHNGTANQVIIASVSSQAIRGAGPNTTSLPLVGQGECVWLVSNGADWTVDSYVPPIMRPNSALIRVEDMISSAPVSPAPGARYIVLAAFSTFEIDDVIEADGAGGFIEYNPVEGWLAYVASLDVYVKFTAGWALVVPLASDTAAGIIEIAVQSEIETGFDNTRAVTPGRQHFHLSAAKAWGVVTVSGGTPTLQSNYNISSITDTATGRLTVTINIDFSSTNYAVLATAESATTFHPTAISVTGATKAAGSFELCNTNLSDTLGDPTSWSFACFGDQA